MQTNEAHALTEYFFKIHFNIILQSSSTCFKRSIESV
jgi:hypothetical protein